MTHINSGTDTTINSVVIDDSKREKEQKTLFTYTLRLKMDGQFPGAPDYDEWVISEDVYNFVKASYNALKLKKISDSDPLSHTPAHPPEAQQRIDAAIKELYKARGAGTFEEIDNHIDEAIALLQAGRK